MFIFNGVILIGERKGEEILDAVVNDFDVSPPCDFTVRLG